MHRLSHTDSGQLVKHLYMCWSLALASSNTRSPELGARTNKEFAHSFVLTFTRNRTTFMLSFIPAFVSELGHVEISQLRNINVMICWLIKVNFSWYLIINEEATTRCTSNSFCLLTTVQLTIKIVKISFSKLKIRVCKLGSSVIRN